LTNQVSVPTVVDDEAEPAEQIRLSLTTWPPGEDDRELVGTVTDQP